LATLGRLQITARQDLGGLGAEQGPSFTYHWRGWDLLPSLLPWLVLAGMLALKGNRRWSAWWIWLPPACIAVCVAAGWHCVEPGLQELRSVPWLKQVLGVLFDVPSALAFGVAALCLLVPRLDCSQRFGTGLRVVVLLVGLSACSFAVAGLWNEGLGEGGLPLLFVPGLLGLNVAAAVVLSGLACHRYRPVRLWLCFSLSVLALSFALAVPCYSVGAAVCPLPLGSLSRLIIPFGLLIAFITFATLLPFLVLTLANRLFRGRIKTLFQVAEI